MDFSGIFSDHELINECKDRISKGASHPRIPIVNFQESIIRIDEAVSSSLNAPAPFISDSGAEAVILKIGRPALIVRNGTFEVPESDIWKARLAASRTLLEAAIASCGRIELKNHMELAWCGTGWLVKPNVFATCRHVAEYFASQSLDGTIHFRVNNSINREIAASLDLREEYMQPQEIELKVIRVLYMEDGLDPDIAFLQVDIPEALSLNPIPITDTVAAGDQVAAIGFPAKSDLRDDPQVVLDLFGGIGGVKRLSPGSITLASTDLIEHDCSTLMGSSGGPIVNLANGKVSGLHTSGFSQRQNIGVPGTIINERLARLH